MATHIVRPGVSQDVAIGAASTATANPISPNICAVMLVATSACYVTINTNPTATKPGGMRLAPNFPVFVRVVGGEKVAVIEDSASGTLTVTEITG